MRTRGLIVWLCNMPRWAWLTLAVVSVLLLLPLYWRWVMFAAGPSCARLIEWLLPRVA
jgi:hypothetical protein